MIVNANYSWLKCTECLKITRILPGQKFKTADDLAKLFECNCVKDGLPLEQIIAAAEAIESQPDLSIEEKEIGEAVAKAMIKLDEKIMWLNQETDENLKIIAKEHNIMRASTMKRETLIQRIADAT